MPSVEGRLRDLAGYCVCGAAVLAYRLEGAADEKEKGSMACKVARPHEQLAYERSEGTAHALGTGGPRRSGLDGLCYCGR